jgi:hypothetical protein
MNFFRALHLRTFDEKREGIPSPPLLPQRNLIDDRGGDKLKNRGDIAAASDEQTLAVDVVAVGRTQHAQKRILPSLIVTHHSRRDHVLTDQQLPVHPTAADTLTVAAAETIAIANSADPAVGRQHDTEIVLGGNVFATQLSQSPFDIGQWSCVF